MTSARLQYPFRFEERRVLLEDQILYVPPYLTDYESFPPLDWSQVFGNEHPVSVEFCSGNGHWIIDRALENPEHNWVAIDKRFDRVSKIWLKRNKASVNNLLMICGDGVTSAHHYIGSGSVEAAYINFPDPWPRRRQHKHRLLTPQFVEQLERILLPSGKVLLATDDGESVLRFKEEMVGRFEVAQELGEWPGYGCSTFEKLWRRLGRAIQFVNFRRVDA
jgi:tRNA (guanine-N7-)-methyltransferase